MGSIKARLGVDLPGDVLILSSQSGKKKSGISHRWVLFSSNEFKFPGEKRRINESFCDSLIEFINSETGVSLKGNPDELFLIAWTGKRAWFRGWLLVYRTGNYAVIEEMEY